MRNSNAIPWKRLTAEGTAIVLSILLAFWIDAWWQQKAALTEANALIDGLYSDFQDCQSHLDEWLAGNKRALRSATEFLEELRATAINDEVLIREVVVNQLVPVLSQQVRLGSSFEFSTMFNWFMARQSVVLDDQYKILATPELEGVLAEKVFYTTFVVDGLTAIHRTQADILRLLEAHLGEP
jgi:hypothetical protein